MDLGMAEAAEYEELIRRLVSVHKHCGEAVNWHDVIEMQAPPEPDRLSTNEEEARHAQITYKPSFWDKILKREPSEMN